MSKIQLSTAQQFEIERFNRTIDNADNLEELRNVAKQLLQAWQLQRAATKFIIEDTHHRMSEDTRAALDKLDKLD